MFHRNVLEVKEYNYSREYCRGSEREEYYRSSCPCKGEIDVESMGEVGDKFGTD